MGAGMAHEFLQSVSEYELNGSGIRVEKISDGLGFGDGHISRLAIEDQARAAGITDLPQRAHEAITHPDLLTPISRGADGRLIQDDGCGDGRRVGLVYRGGQLFRTSLYRPKVFGGGRAMATAAEIALGNAPGMTLSEASQSAADLLDRRDMDYGAHTTMSVKKDSQASGCGCWDEYLAALGATGSHENVITGNLAHLVGRSALSELAESNMFERFAAVAERDDPDYSGAAAMADILARGKVVKALHGGHLETDLVINEVRGYTADQEFVRNYTGEAGMIFSVDAWRIKDLATGLYDDPALQRRAELGMLAFTLGVSSVLTAGDQRVWTVKSVA